MNSGNLAIFFLLALINNNKCRILFDRFPDLRLNAEPTMLPEEVRSPPRASCYDNVHDLRPLSEQVRWFGTLTIFYNETFFMYGFDCKSISDNSLLRPSINLTSLSFSQASDDGTVFSEPWDSSQWDGLIPPSNGHQLYDNVSI